MRPIFHLFVLVLISPLELTANGEAVDPVLAKHREGAEKVADLQDELSADVQQLVIEQTVPKVIELLNEVEVIMDEATDQLASHETGGRTIAAQTEVIEKIHAAAKEKQKQQGSGQSGGAMMDMMERMMGKKPEGESQGKGKKDGEGGSGEEAGKGSGGLSDAGNDMGLGQAGGKNEARRIPKAAGSAGLVLPEEFRKAFDAYNRGAEQKLKQ
jgi:hypothetical protein